MNHTVRICSLASGSNGNAYYIETENGAILIDVGISYRQLVGRARSQKLNLQRIKAAFITHEHSDHVRGLRVFCNKYNIPAYMTAGTANRCKPYYMPADPVRKIAADSVTVVGDITVHSFSKPHDVAEPCSFMVEAHGVNIGVFTDIGTNCPGLSKHLAMCHVAFLESNYDEAMLWAGRYPQQLKVRVASDVGHLSNKQAADIVEEVNPPLLHTLILSHISADNNRPQIAAKEFERFGGRYRIMTASRYEAGEVYTVTTEECTSKPKEIIIPERLDRQQLAIKF